MSVGTYNSGGVTLADKQSVGLQMDSSGNLRTMPTGSDPTASWSYAAAVGGIVNTTTAVTIKAAAGAGVRNYLTGVHIAHDLLGGATEIAVRDGAGGTVLWRGRLQTTATDSSAGHGITTFNPPLRGSANTILEVVTLTAVTGGVYVNATGYTGV